jgi:DUF2946 family protein
MTRFRKSAAAWLGLLAIVLNALVPFGSLGHAGPADINAGICTASGFRPAPAAPKAPAAPASPAERTQCTLCAHCAPSGSHGALPSADPLFPPQASTGPGLQHATESFTLAWVPGARPRAPPLSSAAV